MRFALSTNWCNRRLESGEEIADKAEELGFAALELGFCTTSEQVAGFRRRLDRMPVESVHAFCPIPISAPAGSPELYALASRDAEARAMARVQILRNIRFAADIGATALVLHAGRIPTNGLWPRRDMQRRVSRGRKMVDVFKREVDALLPELEKSGVRLGLENLPYLEGFPSEAEWTLVCGDWVRPWLDTGHDHVRRANGWCPPDWPDMALKPLGLHLNDSVGGDDHLPPGKGQVDFAALVPFMRTTQHLVLEPNASVSEDDLRAALRFLDGIAGTAMPKEQ